MKDEIGLWEEFLLVFENFGGMLSSLESFVLEWVSAFYDPYGALVILREYPSKLRFDPRGLYLR